MPKSALKKRSTTVPPNSYHPPAPPPAAVANQVTAADDDGLDVLHLGSSVDVNDEARRLVAAELRELDAAAAGAGQQVAREERAAAALARERRRGWSECAGLRLQSSELLAALQVNATVLGGLEGTVRMEILASDDNSGSSSSSSNGAAAPVTPTRNSNANDEDDKQQQQPQPPHPPVTTAADLAAHADEVAAELSWMREQHAGAAATLQDSVARRDETVATLQATVELVARDGLKSKRATAAEHTAQARETLADEQGRWRALRTQVADAQERQAAATAECEEMEATLEAQQQADAARLAQLQKELAEQEEAVRRDEREALAALDKEGALLDRQRAPLETCLRAAAELRAQRREAAAVLDRERAARKALFAEQAAKEAAAAAVREKLEDRARHLHEAREQAGKVAALKQENDAAGGEELGEQHRQETAALKQVTELLEAGVVAADGGDDDTQTKAAQLEHALQETAVQQADAEGALATETAARDGRLEQRARHQRALDGHRAAHGDLWQTAVVGEGVALTATETALQERLDENHRAAAEALEWGRTLKIFRSAKATHKVLRDKEERAAAVSEDEEEEEATPHEDKENEEPASEEEEEEASVEDLD